MWLSVHFISGVPTVNHAAHIQFDVFANRGVVCFDEKYLVHQSCVPHDTLFTVVHVAEHDELDVPFLLPSSHASLPFFIQSPHHSWSARHVSDTFQWLSHCHVYICELECFVNFVTVHLSHNHCVYCVIRSVSIDIYFFFVW